MELGSEFNICLEDLEVTQNSIYFKLKNYNTYFLDSGRSAIKLLHKKINMGEVLLPEYICDSVIEAFSGNKINYYRLKKDLTIDLDDLGSKINNETSVVFIMHYFGALQPKGILDQIKDMKSKNDFIVIEDTTHSFFSQMQTIGDYCICSLRKWFPIPDGGVIYSQNSLDFCMYEKLEVNRNIDKAYGMLLKTLYLDKKMDANLLYRKIFVETESEFDKSCQIKKISNFSKYLLNCYDISHLMTKRKDNYAQLLKEVELMGLKTSVRIEKDWCPFVLTISLTGRDKFREYLIRNKIYCAVHWPLNETPLYENSSARKRASRMISLPIDQRYGDREMKYLIAVLKRYDWSIEC